MTDITIRTDLRPGDLGRLIALHGAAYEGENTPFGLVFEAYVARTVAEFVIDNGARGRVWLAEREGALVATAAMVERRAGNRIDGQLRWIVADPSVRGMGIGRRLIDAAMAFARGRGYSAVFLETTEGLDASMAIYEKLGFAVTARERQPLWLDENVVITMRLDLLA